MFPKVIIVFVFHIFLFSNVLVRSDDNVIKTSSGSVRGLTIEILGHSVDQYLGIPYAEPPIGSLRFAKPKPISKPIEVSIELNFYVKEAYHYIQNQYLKA